MVWPNPTVSALIVNLKSFEGGTGEIKLFDVHGRKVLQKRIRLDAGNTTVALNSLEKFHRGVYHLQVRVGEMSYSNKIVLT